MRGQADSSLKEVPPPDGPPLDLRQIRGGVFARGPVVRVMTVVIVALIFCMAALIWWRWINVREPSSAVLVIGDSSMDGTQVIVSGKYGTGPWRGVLSAENNFEVPILLEPGQYHVSVTHKTFNLEKDFVVDRLHMVPFQLPCAVTIEVPFASRDVQAIIESEKGERLTAMLRDQGNSRGAAGVVYLLPGGYGITAMGEQHSIAHQDIYVDHAKPVRLRFEQPLQSQP